MNMVKEGIQTRRRKQRNINGNLPTKFKQNKHTNSTIPVKEGKPCTSESNLNHGLITPEEYTTRQGNYKYSDLYPQHLHLVSHTYPSAFEQHQRFSSQQQLEMTTNGFDAELCARELVTSPLSSTDSSATNNIKNGEEQHLNVSTTANSNRP